MTDKKHYLVSEDFLNIATALISMNFTDGNTKEALLEEAEQTRDCGLNDGGNYISFLNVYDANCGTMDLVVKYLRQYGYEDGEFDEQFPDEQKARLLITSAIHGAQTVLGHPFTRSNYDKRIIKELKGAKS